MKYITIFTLLFITFSISAQKLKSDKMFMPNIQMAIEPLNTDFKTYSVKVVSKEYPLEALEFVTADLAKKYFNFERYEYVTEKGDLEVVVTLGNQRVSSAVKKDKNGKYAAQVTYGTPLTLALKDGKRILIKEEIIDSGKDRKTEKVGNEYASIKDAQKYWKKNSYKLKAELLSKKYLAAFTKVNGYIEMMDNRLAINKYDLFYLKDAKDFSVPFDKDYNKSLKKEMKNIAKEKDIEACKAKLLSLIPTWEKYYDHGTPEVQFLVKYNTAVAHMIATDYAEAKRFAEMAFTTKVKSDWVEFIHKEIDNRSKRVELNSNFTNEFAKTYDETAEVMSAAKDNITGEEVELRDYVLTKDGKKIHGILTVKGLLGGSISKIYVDPKKTNPSQVERIEADNIEEVHSDGKTYVQRKFQIKGNLKAKNYVFHKLYENGEYTLLEMTARAESSGINDSPYFIFGPEKVYEMKNLHILNFNKGVSKNFDCPVVKEKASQKFYKRNDVDKLKALIDDLSGC